MAKKDTYLALLRRGIDDSTAQLLADAGLKIGDLKKIDAEKLVENITSSLFQPSLQVQSNRPGSILQDEH